MTLLSLVLFMALTPLVSMTATPAAGTPGIAPHTWEVDNLTLADAVPVEIGAPERYTAQFLPDGKATFQSDCNRGGANYRASDGQFALANLAVTDVPCSPGSLSLEVVTLLTSAESYRFDDTGNLILRGRQGALRLRPALTGVTWQWRGIAGNDGVIFVAPAVPERYTVEFLAEGALAIQIDCNQGRGRARIDGITMAIRVGGTTRMACLSDSLGGLYVTGLNNVEHWYLFNGVLSLSLPDGAGMMIFSPVVTARAIPPGAE